MRGRSTATGAPKTPGLDWLFARHSDVKFGAVFTCHVEDYHLYLFNHCHLGRKSWIVIPTKYAQALED